VKAGREPRNAAKHLFLDGVVLCSDFGDAAGRASPGFLNMPSMLGLGTGFGNLAEDALARSHVPEREGTLPRTLTLWRPEEEGSQIN
jgi:hypothetical protein